MMLFKFVSLLVTGMVGFGAHSVGVSQERIAIVQSQAVASNAVPAGVDVTLIPSTPAPSFNHGSHEDQSSICVNSRTREHYVGELVSREEVVFWVDKYWDGWDLDVAVAITRAEGQRDLNCWGDEEPRYYGQPTSDGRHYAESVGLYQYRTIIEATGKGGCEDKLWQLGHIDRQTECAYNDKWKRRGWQPWTQYTNGNYKKSLGK